LPTEAARRTPVRLRSSSFGGQPPLLAQRRLACQP
jgi:hypothetical protein